MNYNLYFDYAGVSFRVNADVVDDAGCVEQVNQVAAIDIANNEYTPLSVDKVKFLKDMEDVLNEAVEQEKLNAKLAHEDMLFEQARERRIWGLVK